METNPEFEERRKKTIWQRMDEVDGAAAAGHTRLRKSVDALETQFDALVSEQNVLAEKVKAVSEGPVDAAKLTLTSRAIVALVLGVVTIAGSVWASAASTNRNMERIETKVDAQAAATIAAAKLQDVQMSTLRDAATDAKNTAADAKRQYELLRYEFQSLKETVIQKGK